MTAYRPALLLAALAALAGCDRPSRDAWLGYVEAEYTYVAPLEAGRIVALEVDRGDQVDAGQALFTLESDAEQAARDQAAAELAQAESDLFDLQKGDRPEDLAIIQAQLDKAQASLALSVPRLQRREKMVKGSIIGEEELDEAKSQILADRGNIAEYEARLTEGRLPARIDKIAAAEKLVEARKAALADAEWRLSRRQEKAPAAGRIEDVFFRTGETASTAMFTPWFKTGSLYGCRCASATASESPWALWHRLQVASVRFAGMVCSFAEYFFVQSTSSWQEPHAARVGCVCARSP